METRLLDMLTEMAAGRLIELLHDVQAACGQIKPEDWAEMAEDLREQCGLVKLLVDCQIDTPARTG